MSLNHSKQLAYWHFLSDGLAGLVGMLGFTAVTTWFHSITPGWQVLTIGILYTLFCTAVYQLRQLAPQLPQEEGRLPLPDMHQRANTLGILAGLFGIILAVLFLDLLGYWQSIFIVNDRQLGAGESSAFFAYAPGAFVATALLYILILSGKNEGVIPLDSNRYHLTTLLTLLGINGMLLAFSVVFQGIVQTWTAVSPLLTFPLIFLLLLLLLGPPRLWYLTKRPLYSPLLTFLLLLLYYSWRVVG